MALLLSCSIRFCVVFAAVRTKSLVRAPRGVDARGPFCIW